MTIERPWDFSFKDLFPPLRPDKSGRLAVTKNSGDTEAASSECSIPKAGQYRCSLKIANRFFLVMWHFIFVISESMSLLHEILFVTDV